MKKQEDRHMKIKYKIFMILLLVAVPFSYGVSGLEADYWPVSAGDILNYNYVNETVQGLYYDAEILLTIDEIHESGIIDYHTVVTGSEDIEPEFNVSTSTLDDLTLEYRAIVILYSQDYNAQQAWNADFEDIQNFWAQNLSFSFEGELTQNGYEYEVRNKSDNRRQEHVKLEYTKNGILRKFSYELLVTEIEPPDIYYSYREAFWYLKRTSPAMGYLVMSLTLVALGAIGVKVILMWIKDRKGR